jgi:hypothetical protein
MSTDINILSSKADDYLRARKARLAKQREVDELEVVEKKLKAEIIAALAASSAKAIGGQTVTLTLKTKNKPVARDWSQVYDYIKQHDAFDLLQKRLTETAVSLRWEEGEVIPGIEKFPVDDLSISEK